MFDLLDAYRTMCRMRYFEEEVYRLFLQNLVKGSTHLGTGQEAVAAGVSAAMRSTDYVLATYRGHNHVLARGVAMEAIFGELMGKEAGLNRGRGGSMHLTSVEHRMMGCYAIVGAHLPVANGLAMASQLRSDGAVTTCFFGDGATNIGAFHEALNLAALWKLPVLFVCENNLYMEYSPIAEMIPIEHPAADRSGAYGLDRYVVDGNDVAAVYGAVAPIVEQVRSGQGPALIEALTYRTGGHSRADPGTSYRPADEIAEWKAKDPLMAAGRRLMESGTSPDELKAMTEGEREAVRQASATAMEWADANPTGVEADLWADGSATWRR